MLPADDIGPRHIWHACQPLGDFFGHAAALGRCTGKREGSRGDWQTCRPGQRIPTRARHDDQNGEEHGQIERGGYLQHSCRMIQQFYLCQNKRKNSFGGSMPFRRNIIPKKENMGCPSWKREP